MTTHEEKIQEFNRQRAKFVTDFHKHRLICSQMLDEIRDKGTESFGTAASLLEVEYATKAYTITNPAADKFAEIELEFVKRIVIHRVVIIGFGGIYTSQDGSPIQINRLIDSYKKSFNRVRECVNLIDQIYGVKRKTSKTNSINVPDLFKNITNN